MRNYLDHIKLQIGSAARGMYIYYGCTHLLRFFWLIEQTVHNYLIVVPVVHGICCHFFMLYLKTLCGFSDFLGGTGDVLAILRVYVI